MAKIFVSFNIVNPSNCFLVVREKDNPLAEVYRSDLLITPHTQRNITVDNLNPVMHIVQLWTTSDNVNLGSLIGSCDIDASISNSVAFGYIQIVVGRGNGAPEYDPEENQGQYVNTDLDGKTYLVYKEGYGVLKWGIDIQEIAGGGFEYINGQEFSFDEGYTIQYSNVTTSTSESSGKSYPEDIIEITANTTFGSSHYNKLIEVNGSVSGSIISITITSLDAIPNGTKFGINTHNGNQRYVTLKLDSGKYCLINNTINGPQQRNEVYIGRGEEVNFIKKGSYLRIINGGEPFSRLGQRIYADGLQPINSLPETGGWYLKTDYPRFFNWYISELPSGELGTGSDDVTPDDTNKRKFIIGTNKFWVPDTSGLFFRATSADSTVDIDGPRLANSYQADDNKSHNHVSSPYNRASAKADEAGGNQIPIVDNNNSGANLKYRVAGMDSSRWTAATIVNQGTEARGKNVATNVYRLI